MKKFPWLWFCLAWLLGGTVCAAPAEPLQPPQQVIQDTATRLRVLMEREAGRLRDDPAYIQQLAEEVLVPQIHLGQLSAAILGRHWRQASSAQQQAFAAELKHFMVRTYATALRELGHWEISFLPLRLGDGQTDALVRTRVSRSGAPPLSMDYRMCLRDGRWQAYDLSIEGIGLAANYRTGFAQTIEQKGLDGLIEDLAARNAERLNRAGAGAFRGAAGAGDGG